MLEALNSEVIGAPLMQMLSQTPSDLLHPPFILSELFLILDILHDLEVFERIIYIG